MMALCGGWLSEVRDGDVGMMMEDLCFIVACCGENEACDEGDGHSRWSGSNSDLELPVSNLGLFTIKACDLLERWGMAMVVSWLSQR